MMFRRKKALLQALDTMLDRALAGTLQAESYDESLLSKIESKMVRFLDASRTRRKQIEEEQAQIRSLISDISHQTKTPLANISLYSQLLAEENLTQAQKNLVNRISDGEQKLRFLIEALVKTSRLECGLINIEPKPGNVYDLLQTAVHSCIALAEEKQIALSFPRESGSLSVRMDFRWCAEALGNIIENAVKYTDEAGCVRIALTEYEMFARIDIADTGRGIAEADLPHIFLRFWRGENAVDSPGAGIGLYLAREIITACDGYIKVSSAPQQGTVFSVFLSKV